MIDITGLPEELWWERTFEKLKASHDIQFKLAKNCNSTVEKSLLKEKADVRVLVLLQCLANFN